MSKPTESRQDHEFISYQTENLIAFFNSKDTVKHLEPMNSYQRRLVHRLASSHKFETDSEGEGDDRHIVVAKTDATQMPENVNNTAKTPVWNFGDREILVDSLQKNIDIVLMRDGSVHVYDKAEKPQYLDRRKVWTGSFKIKNNKIVVIEDDEW